MRRSPPDTPASTADFAHTAAPVFLRMAVVVRMTGLGRSTIYRMVAEQRFAEHQQHWLVGVGETAQRRRGKSDGKIRAWCVAGVTIWDERSARKRSAVREQRASSSSGRAKKMAVTYAVTAISEPALPGLGKGPPWSHRRRTGPAVSREGWKPAGGRDSGRMTGSRCTARQPGPCEAGTRQFADPRCRGQPFQTASIAGSRHFADRREFLRHSAGLAISL